ncbi:MAG: response regulator transcription factor [Sulfurimonas sp.]|jgi:DNA-binding response OmpR family regulator|uniref:response regulator n=1 Tax=unclassified Sulfurimonas TaxID=2623549 RepID=UPI0008C3CF01|nr:MULTISPECIES: response regulator transcription factor [unclassified Sulfurimonas]OHE12014.1 MAG: DNA-binding response regulator [Sulfurimonas sp. RIFOXYD12_FULL_36_11]MBS4068499.1 response regulator transcription factor [Sulfurimonas sp.]MDD3854935.1 response regulator transcription factor [Sulfurimonas sp.]MDX9757493.1 response regulator transcription factor [Sulfurimonas sp.]OHE04427.1 MAG: DNA-binding response regulator [Sulfurimonas sp. RIFOXYB12_FULL_35_9]
MRILIVEDDEKIASFIKKGLQEESYSVDITENGYEAIYLIETNKYDVILLDLMIHGLGGIDVCKNIRDKNIATPIIMLTAKDSLRDKVEGLDSGANDYLIKPFAFEELLARIRVKLRNPSTTSSTIVIADLTIDTARREVSRSDKKINLTAKEYALLEFLARNSRKLLSETTIKDNLSDMAQESMSNIVNVYIYRLRNKIDKGYDLKLIHTVRGLGYMLSDKDV